MQFKLVHNYNSSFNDVTTAFWKKQFIPYRDDLKSIDIINRSISNDYLNTTRLIINKPRELPSWIPSDGIIALEKTTINPKLKILTGSTANITLRNLCEIKEDFKYEEITPTLTNYEMNVNVKVHIPIIGNKIESLIVSLINKTSNNGIKIMLDLIKQNALKTN